MTTTDDFRALNNAYYGETVALTGLTLHRARAREAYLHAVDVEDRMVFHAWLESLRESQAALEEKATCAWLQAVIRSGVATMGLLRKGGAGCS